MSSRPKTFFLPSVTRRSTPVSVPQGVITAELLPAVVSVSAAIVSFSIGTSWGTVGIMFPVADHVDHVNTQIPYAILCGTVGTGLFLASGYGVSPLALLAVGVPVLGVAAYGLSEHATVRMPRVFSSDAD